MDGDCRTMRVVWWALVVTLLCSGARGGLPDPEKHYCDKEADILLLLDSSESVRRVNFVKVQAFAAHLTGHYNVGKDHVRFGTAAFGSGVEVGSTFSAGHHMEGVVESIGRLEYSQDSTRLDRALKYAANRAFTGRHGGRENATRYIILITDTEDSLDERSMRLGRQLKSMGVNIVVVAVGPYVPAWSLTSLASGTNSYFPVETYDDLRSIMPKLVQETCATAAAPPAPTPPPTHPDDCDRQADVLITVDASGSINRDDFYTLQDNIADLVTMAFGSQMEYGFLQFGTYVLPILGFDENREPEMVAQHWLFYEGQQTNTHLALKEAGTFFKPEKGARPGAAPIILLFTDGYAKDPEATKQEAEALKEAGITIITVGVGKKVSMEDLEAVASPGYQFDASDLSTMKEINREIVGVVQKLVEEKCPDSPPPPCPNPVDALIVMDASGSLPEATFDLTKVALSRMVSLEVEGSSVKYAFLTFGTFIKPVAYFNTGLDPAMIARDFLFYEGMQTKTHLALREAAKFFTEANGARQRADSFIVLFTDGHPTDLEATLAEADLLKKSGVTIVTVGVGRNLNKDTLEKMASDPKLSFLGSDNMYGEGGFTDKVIDVLRSHRCMEDLCEK